MDLRAGAKTKGKQTTLGMQRDQVKHGIPAPLSVSLCVCVCVCLFYNRTVVLFTD